MQSRDQSQAVGFHRQRDWLLLLLVMVLVCLCYINILNGEFQFDDGYIISDYDGRFLKNPFHMLSKGVFHVFISGDRLIPAFTFYLDYIIGKGSPMVFHISSILWHILTIVLVYIFLISLFEKAYEDTRTIRLLALLGTALWGVHPLQTEAVSYISQRSEVIASLFYVLAVMTFERFVKSEGRGRQAGYAFLLILVFVLGWLSKLIVVSLPITLLVYSIFFFNKSSERKKSLLVLCPVALLAAFTGIKILLSTKGSAHVGFDIKGLGQPDYFYTQMRVILTYLRLIFFPYNQNLDHDYPVYRSILNLNVLGPSLLWIFLIALSFLTLRIKEPSKRPLKLAGFGMLWFFILLSVTSSVVPLRDVIYEHRVYLASLGIVVVVLSCLSLILKPRQITVLVMIVFLALALTTFNRNYAWQTRLSLWQDAARKSPNKSRAHNNLGNAYYALGQNLKAFEHYKKAFELDPDNIEAIYNMGLILETLGRKQESVYYYMLFVQKSKGKYPMFLKRIKEKFFSGKYGTINDTGK